MARSSFILSLTIILALALLSNAQTNSVTTVPPLQWINLSDLLSGSPPPKLKDASIGYDETSRSLIIFGGESEGGFPQSQTYLLDLEQLTWSIPAPPLNLQTTPPARSAAVSGVDFAASNRHGYVIIGGKGSENEALSDVWEYDFTNQFWSEVVVTPGGPSPRWGASGGIDVRTPFVQDPVLPGPNNTFYLAGGYDGANPIPLSDLWRLSMSGALSSNLPNSSTGSWERLSVGQLPGKIDQGGTVIAQSVISAGGCSTSTVVNNSCAQGESYVIDIKKGTEISPRPCPAPRLSPALAPNMNAFSTDFAAQVFMLGGTFNESLWQDNGGLEAGEVAILHSDTGSWSRILPAGDPGSTNNPTYPIPREGAAAVSYFLSLVGTSRNASADTVLFGGRDLSGNYLSDVWLLRAYSGSVTASNPNWAGFGNGKLETGVDAGGSGVSVKFLATCASQIDDTASSAKPAFPTQTSATASTSLNSPANTSPASPISTFDIPVTHKLLAPLSIALIFPAVLLVRLSSSYLGHSTSRQNILIYLSAFIAIIAYGMGIAGIATSFTSVTSSQTLARRSPSGAPILSTAHGIAGLTFFVGMYGLVPLLVVISFCVARPRTALQARKAERSRVNSIDTPEKVATSPSSAPQSTCSPSVGASPRPRTHSWGPSSLWRRSPEERHSSDSESSSSPPTRGFEVLNRPPPRPRRTSTSGLAAQTDTPLQRLPIAPRSLGDISWLERRRSLNAVNELDYQISQTMRAIPSTPATTEALLHSAPLPLSSQQPTPPVREVLLTFLFHLFLLGLCIISLVELWVRAPRATFAVFLAWTIIFYCVFFIFAWRGRSRSSTAAVLFSRLRTKPQSPIGAGPPPAPAASDQFSFPTTNMSGPYIHHQPAYHRALSSGPDDTSNSHGWPQSVDSDDDDDDDDDVRQQRMEEEMGRRDISVVTVPKRKLWITNI